MNAKRTHMQASRTALATAAALLPLLAVSTLAETPPQQPKPDAAELRRKIESLRPEKLVWEEIGWNYCLLEGLKKSRAQNKPALLWAFINSDPASERC